MRHVPDPSLRPWEPPAYRVDGDGKVVDASPGTPNNWGRWGDDDQRGTFNLFTPERIAAAAALLPGRHDFRLFCERPAEQPSTVVVVERAEVATAGSLILCRLVASHFLWKMVRRVTGALVRAGAGELDLDAFAALLDADSGAARLAAPGRRPLRPAEWTAPPSGLFLERVLYPGDPPLPPLASTPPVVTVS